jgi:hypothetical protein
MVEQQERITAAGLDANASVTVGLTLGAAFESAAKRRILGSERTFALLSQPIDVGQERRTGRT